MGFMLGLLGGGGSILATPLLLYVVGVSQPHVAIGTGALAVSVNAFANFTSHALKGNVWWRCGAVFSALGVIGALIGSSLGKALDGDRLIFLFGILMIVVGLFMLKPKKRLDVERRPVDLRMCLVTAAIALASGAASGFFGMPMINAIGTSLLSVGAFGLATALNYASSGLIDWWLAAEFIGGGIIGGVFGMMLATRLSAYKNVLNRIFATIIFIVAAYILYRNGVSFG